MPNGLTGLPPLPGQGGIAPPLAGAALPELSQPPDLGQIGPPGLLQQQNQPGISPDNMPKVMDFLLSMLAGAGFEKLSKGIADLAKSGVDANQLLQTPNLKLLVAGAGFKDVMGSMGQQSEAVLTPLIKTIFQPPTPPQPEQGPSVADILPALASSLGPGLMGLRPPPEMRLPPGGLPPGAPGLMPPIAEAPMVAGLPGEIPGGLPLGGLPPGGLPGGPPGGMPPLV
jgi:hypothetical protein